MDLLSVPYYIGCRIAEFDLPEPHTVIDPVLPHDGVTYDTGHAEGEGGPAQARMSVLYRELADRVAESELPVVYAGDCLAVIGVLAGLERRGVEPVLYWFDAHADFHTWETTQSRFLGGMPLAMLTGRGEQTIVDASGLTPIADTNVVLVDGRDLDPGEDAAVASSGMAVMTVGDVVTAEPGDRPIYVHVDVDVVDPSELPGVNYPAPGGPSTSEVAQAVERLAATGRVVAASVSSWNPELPGADVSAAATTAIMRPLL